MAEARRRVRERFGIELEHEVQFLGPLELPPRRGTSGRGEVGPWPPSRRTTARATTCCPRAGRARRGAHRAVGPLALARARTARTRGRRLPRRARDLGVRRCVRSRSPAGRRRSGRPSRAALRDELGREPASRRRRRHRQAARGDPLGSRVHLRPRRSRTRCAIVVRPERAGARSCGRAPGRVPRRCVRAGAAHARRTHASRRCRGCTSRRTRPSPSDERLPASAAAGRDRARRAARRVVAGRRALRSAPARTS